MSIAPYAQLTGLTIHIWQYHAFDAIDRCWNGATAKWGYIPLQELTQSFVGKDIPVTVVDVDQALNRFVGNNVQALNVKAVSNCKVSPSNTLYNLTYQAASWK